MKHQNPIEDTPINAEPLRSQVMTDLGYLLARWWLDQHDKNEQEPRTSTPDAQPTK